MYAGEAVRLRSDACCASSSTSWVGAKLGTERRRAALTTLWEADEEGTIIDWRGVMAGVAVLVDRPDAMPESREAAGKPLRMEV